MPADISTMMLLTLLTSIFLTAVGTAFLRPVAYLFGAAEHMLPDIMIYGTICLSFNLAMHLQCSLYSTQRRYFGAVVFPCKRRQMRVN